MYSFEVFQDRQVITTHSVGGLAPDKPLSRWHHSVLAFLKI